MQSLKRIFKAVAIGMVLLIGLSMCASNYEPSEETLCMNRVHSKLNKQEKVLGVEYTKDFRYSVVNRECKRGNK